MVWIVNKVGVQSRGRKTLVVRIIIILNFKSIVNHWIFDKKLFFVNLGPSKNGIVQRNADKMTWFFCDFDWDGLVVTGPIIHQSCSI